MEKNIQYISTSDGLMHPIDALSIGGIPASSIQLEENLVTSISAESTDKQYPSAKCLYEIFGDLGICGITTRKNWVLIDTIKESQTKTLNLEGYNKLGLFIVGGGGSGHGDFYGGGTGGNGGNGGQVMVYDDIEINGDYISVSIGEGGQTAKSQQDSNDGEPTSVTYNGIVYSALGGYGGDNLRDNSNWEELGNRGYVNKSMEHSSLGGIHSAISYSYTDDVVEYINTHTALQYGSFNGSVICGGKGEDGHKNPFDLSDKTLYAPGGGAGSNAYLKTKDKSSPGGKTGGGCGGYGSDNSALNAGVGATSYGGGGGGGSFSSEHTYSTGGAGYKGIVLIYASK